MSMFSLFTDRASKVVDLASKQAVGLGKKSIDSEEILIGLILEASGVAAWVIKNAGLDEQKIRRSRTVEDSTNTENIVTIANNAQKEMKALGHKHVGTEHLLLAIISEETSVAHARLKRLGVDPVKLRQKIMYFIVEPHEFKYPIISLEEPERFLKEFKEVLKSQMMLPKELEHMDVNTIVTITMKKKVPIVPT